MTTTGSATIQFNDGNIWTAGSFNNHVHNMNAASVTTNEIDYAQTGLWELIGSSYPNGAGSVVFGSLSAGSHKYFKIQFDLRGSTDQDLYLRIANSSDTRYNFTRINNTTTAATAAAGQWVVGQFSAGTNACGTLMLNSLGVSGGNRVWGSCVSTQGASKTFFIGGDIVPASGLNITQIELQHNSGSFAGSAFLWGMR